MKRPLFILAALTLSLFSGSFTSFAEEDPNVERIELKPFPEHAPPKAKAPSRVRISAYRNGDVLVITSTVNVTAEIQIIDLDSGVACFEGSVFLAPELQFPLPPTGSPVAIRIAVGGSIYEGAIGI